MFIHQRSVFFYLEIPAAGYQLKHHLSVLEIYQARNGDKRYTVLEVLTYSSNESSMCSNIDGGKYIYIFIYVCTLWYTNSLLLKVANL